MVKTGTHDDDIRGTLLPSTSRQPLSLSLVRRMYAGHFLARWGARMWEFSVGLYMINIWPDSLLFTAIYGVVESSAIVFFGPLVGKLLDKLTYMKVLRLWLFTQNLSFIVAGVTVTVMLVFMPTAFGAFLLLVIVTNISGAVGALSTLAGTILIEREWVVVISSGQDPEMLTKMNSTIRRIDLTCKLLAPVFSGFIISFISLRASAVTLALWNTISVWLQYWLLTSVYNGIPALPESSQRRASACTASSGYLSLIEANGSLPHSNETDMGLQLSDWRQIIVQKLSNIPFVDAWIVYSQQKIVLPGVALALLYFTVLRFLVFPFWMEYRYFFGTLMTATLEWKGIPAYVIGIARGVSAIIGIAATVVYPLVHSHLSTLRTGLWSIWVQWFFLLVCLASIWVRISNIASAWMLMGGVAASRLGLWMFDLSVMQQMQDDVPDSDRIIVGGVQNSLQSMLDLLTYVMGIIISNPQDFGRLVIMSFLLVTSAALLYTFHVYRVRNHLFHYDKLLSRIPWWG